MENIKVLFACQWGMSSSLLAAKITSKGKERGLQIEVECLAAESALALDLSCFDLVLIGPQVRFYTKKFEEKEEELGINIPIIPVDGFIYATGDGEALLNILLPEIEKSKGNANQ
ncbi:MAG: hypothetical protein Q8N39_08200 [Pelolinea sp.]|nr:hypothetical protein [Pelolinea sp.]